MNILISRAVVDLHVAPEFGTAGTSTDEHSGRYSFIPAEHFQYGYGVPKHSSYHGCTPRVQDNQSLQTQTATQSYRRSMRVLEPDIRLW